MMTYLGYEGTVEFDPEHDVLFGKVLHLNDLITFEGRSVDELKAQFRESVDDYLEWCKELCKDPEKPYSGRFLVRVPQDLHRRVASAAVRADVSLNSFVVNALAAAVERLKKQLLIPANVALKLQAERTGPNRQLERSIRRKLTRSTRGVPDIVKVLVPRRTGR